MTTAEKTLKWWNDYLEQNKTYPLLAEIEMQLNLAVDNEPKVENLAIHDVINTLIAWEQFKKANWYESEAIDVEKMLMDKFQAIYGR